MIRMGVDSIAEAVGGTIVTGKEPVDISNLSIRNVGSDSRLKVSDGLFVAIAGERVDGHDFLTQAAQNGYVAAFVNHEVKGAPLLQIVVSDTVIALGRLARHNLDVRRTLDAPFTVVGITGSVGKTTTKDLTKALLSSVAPTVAPQGSFNNELGLPLTALGVDEKTRFFIAEMGANHIGEIAGLTKIAPPDISVVLKVGTAHLGEFGSMENIFIAKSEIVEALDSKGTAILNSDDPNVSRMQEKTKASVVWFGMDPTKRALSVSATDVSLDDADRPSFTLVRDGQDVGRIKLALSGEHNVMNALAAITIAFRLGMEAKQVMDVLNSTVSLSPHRMALSQVEVDGATFALLDDSFNANPDSMKSGIEGLMRTHKSGYHVAVLGPMLELGSQTVALHSQIGSFAVQHGVDAIVSVGVQGTGESGESKPLSTLAQALRDGAMRTRLAQSKTGEQGTIVTVNSIDEAEQKVKDLASSHPDTVVLLKGSHASGVGQLADRWDADSTAGSQPDQHSSDGRRIA